MQVWCLMGSEERLKELELRSQQEGSMWLELVLPWGYKVACSRCLETTATVGGEALHLVDTDLNDTDLNSKQIPRSFPLLPSNFPLSPPIGGT